MKMKTKTKTTASLAVVGVDIGKEVFHPVGLGTDRTIAFRRKIRRVEPQGRPHVEERLAQIFDLKSHRVKWSAG